MENRPGVTFQEVARKPGSTTVHIAELDDYDMYIDEFPSFAAARKFAREATK